MGIAATMIAPIKRQEPGHYAFYQLSARSLWSQLAIWQKWLVRQMRRISFAPVRVNNVEQLQDFGRVMRTLAMADRPDDLTSDVARVEQELLWARGHGLPVPDYVTEAFRSAVEAAQARAVVGLRT